MRRVKEILKLKRMQKLSWIVWNKWSKKLVIKLLSNNSVRHLLSLTSIRMKNSFLCYNQQMMLSVVIWFMRSCISFSSHLWFEIRTEWCWLLLSRLQTEPRWHTGTNILLYDETQQMFTIFTSKFPK
jgi:hypothetical protein